MTRAVAVSRYRHSLWLLTARDLRVRYSTSALGYLWSILDPLVMAAHLLVRLHPGLRARGRRRAVHRLPAHGAAAVDVVQRRGLRLHAGVHARTRSWCARRRSRARSGSTASCSRKGIEFSARSRCSRSSRSSSGAHGATGSVAAASRSRSCCRPCYSSGSASSSPRSCVLFRDLERAIEARPARSCSTRRRSSTASPTCRAESRTIWRRSTRSPASSRLYRVGVLPRPARLVRRRHRRRDVRCVFLGARHPRLPSLERPVLKEI